MAASASAERTSGRGRGEQLRSLAETFGTLAVAIALLVGFGLTSSVFLQAANLRNILTQITVVAVLALGETIVMLLGAIDLSVGAEPLFGSVVAADLVQRHGYALIIALPIAVLATAGIGLLNGVLTAVIGIEPILATLGTFLVAGGLANVILNSSWIVVDSTFCVDLVQTHVIWAARDGDRDDRSVRRRRSLHARDAVRPLALRGRRDLLPHGSQASPRRASGSRRSRWRARSPELPGSCRSASLAS